MFIHYGSKKFNKFRFDRIKNDNDMIINKPLGGLWACRVEDDGWKKWCEREDFCTEKLKSSFRFDIKKSARWLVIKSVEDLEKLDKYVIEKFCMASTDYLTLDWEVISRDYDVFELVYSWELRSLGFYSWDVSTVLVLNKDVIVEKVSV